VTAQVKATEAKQDISISDRVISLADGLAAIPERLLLAHARGEVSFIAGAGVSQPANLPDFRKLVLQVYAKLDKAVFDLISEVPRDAHNKWEIDCSSLTARQSAEVKSYLSRLAACEDPFVHWSLCSKASSQDSEEVDRNQLTENEVVELLSNWLEQDGGKLSPDVLDMSRVLTCWP
jgi:hypothetical protein